MSKRLEVKDLINIGLFSVLGFIFMMIGSFLAMVPVLMPVVPFCTGSFGRTCKYAIFYQN